MVKVMVRVRVRVSRVPTWDTLFEKGKLGTFVFKVRVRVSKG
jgi:hypothetical protein